MPSLPEPLHAAGESIDNFIVRSVEAVPEVRGRAYRIDHPKSGARILHLHCDDTENLFSINFPTPPPDDTGLPHILEHVVLAGSKRFPVREPFFEMLKMSMATFINAMTAPDCTYYPVASNSPKDLFNLAEVYFDAVFYPLLTEDSFRREGHHLAPADPTDLTGALTVTGIVYNEMKGAYSSPLARLQRSAVRMLLPDTIYGRSSGGEPEVIPDLTYNAFRRYHADYYQAGNAYFFLYGNIPTRDYLTFLEKRLEDLAPRSPVIDLGLQPRWSESRHFDDTYPIGPGESTAEKSYLLLAWLSGDATDVITTIEWYLLGAILLGHEAAPLRKAIIDSGIGADLVSSGAFSIGRELSFAIGVKDSESERSEKFRELVISTLDGIAKRGISSEEVSTALHQAAYHYREVQPMFPLHTMDRVLDAWIYGMDPLSFLRLGEHLEVCRTRYQNNPQMFDQLIRDQLLSNPHRLSLCLRPDPDMQERTNETFAMRMQTIRSGLSDEQTVQIATQAATLERNNSQPNSPEALALLPQLSVDDLPAKVPHLDTEKSDLKGVVLIRNNLFTNGINYLALSFDLVGLPRDLWPFVPRYTSALSKLGTVRQDYETIARRTAAVTGGISASTIISNHSSDPNQPVWRLTVHLKALDEQLALALELLSDLLFQVDATDQRRLHEVIIQTRSHYRTQLVHQGLGTAQTFAARGMSESGHLNEVMSGLPQLDQCTEIAGDFERHAENLIKNIQSLRDFMLNPHRLVASFTGSDSAFNLTSSTLSKWIQDMETNSIVSSSTGFTPLPPTYAGLAGPIQVSHCAKVVEAPHSTDPAAAPLRVGAHLIRMDYLLPEVRFKGNAYGANFNYSPHAGRAVLGSYRDPHIVRTIKVFDETHRYATKADWRQIDIERAIIATAKNDFRPIRPGEATSIALQRYLSGSTPEIRQQRYEALRNVTPTAVKHELSELLAPSKRSCVCVVSSRQKLEDANKELTQPLSVQDILPISND